MPVGDPISQPINEPGNRVGNVLRGDGQLDCAAALIDGVPTADRILGLPCLNPPSFPTVGMHVIKSGMHTGVTEGRVIDVDPGGAVRIGWLAGYPQTGGGSAGYEICLPGDSGAIWVDRMTLAPVALHTGCLPAAANVACGISLIEVLSALNLSFATW